MEPQDKVEMEKFLEEAKIQEFPLRKDFEEVLFQDALEVQSGFTKNYRVNATKVLLTQRLLQFGRRVSPIGTGIVLASTVIGAILGYYAADELEVMTLSALGMYPDPNGFEIYGNLEELLQLDVG
ncbi:MAG: hypothetical protein OXH90_09305 [Paracoccaceae bacterium]|nr:hypothetical protein [Paracoccaceae bacterium]MDE2915913.1 hypothetical protein [Paracoccaceae bacterium]